MKTSYFIVLLVLSMATQAFSQNAYNSFISKDFRSFEYKIGTGFLQKEALVFDFNYQHNILNYLSAVSLTQLTQTVFKINPNKNYLVLSNTFLTEMLGVGANIGEKRFNFGVYLLGGGRFFHSTSTVNELHQPKVIVNKFLPDAGLMYILKIGKAKYYFTTQAYQPIIPVALKKNGETNFTITLGLGCRL